MIPRRFLSKMDTYDITINGDRVKVTYLDNKALLDSCVSEILTHNLTGHMRVVGIDMKKCSESQHIQLLLIYVENRCLIIHLGRMSGPFPSSLSSFLSDDTICFVGPRMSSLEHAIVSKVFSFNTFTVREFGHEGNSTSALLRSGVEIGYLAARVLRNRALQSCGSLAELANITGFHFREEDQNKICPAWNADCFSDEEIKYAMREAYLCYNIGKRVLSTLN